MNDDGPSIYTANGNYTLEEERRRIALGGMLYGPRPRTNCPACQVHTGWREFGESAWKACAEHPDAKFEKPPRFVMKAYDRGRAE